MLTGVMLLEVSLLNILVLWIMADICLGRSMVCYAAILHGRDRAGRRFDCLLPT